MHKSEHRFNIIAAAKRAYLDTLDGRVPPDQGLILSLSE